MLLRTVIQTIKNTNVAAIHQINARVRAYTYSQAGISATFRGYTIIASGIYSYTPLSDIKQQNSKLYQFNFMYCFIANIMLEKTLIFKKYVCKYIIYLKPDFYKNNKNVR